MSEETINELTIYIKSRHDMPEPKIDLAKMLTGNGMGEYVSVCADRIAGALFIDGNHIGINFPKAEIILDKIGLVKCRDILSGYVSKDVLDEYEEAIFYLSEDIAEKNTLLKMLRNFTKKELLNTIEEIVRNKDIDASHATLLREELKARKTVNKLANELKEKSTEVYVKAKYKDVFRLIKTTAEEHADDVPPRIHRKKDWVTYYEALERLTESLGGSIEPDKLDKNNLMKYVFLAVKTVARGKDTKRKILRLEDMQKLHSAIGLLTPKELQQIFPIVKTYDGEKYECKDYFFTMEKIREQGEDKPIGEAFKFLWDYRNFDLMLVALEYSNALEDVYVAQGNKSVFEEIFSGDAVIEGEG